ncbi:hypothetical protein Poli38472_012427 [Pythium oligandrum]|uniref:Uncharacterized protein n=1 Tax=Pythium oligandrum TaxID=41045 RepID=A0A8K1CPA3_PYTOL|nr:hypothetical protein Poli38472_012427 [Pythium oligandrum]|eukprot:TMW67311.1 hypothetical protein Poli38472_012427 [Pythium oligandrum]
MNRSLASLCLLVTLLSQAHAQVDLPPPLGSVASMTLSPPLGQVETAASDPNVIAAKNKSDESMANAQGAFLALGHLLRDYVLLPLPDFTTAG